MAPWVHCTAMLCVVMAVKVETAEPGVKGLHWKVLPRGSPSNSSPPRAPPQRRKVQAASEPLSKRMLLATAKGAVLREFPKARP